MPEYMLGVDIGTSSCKVTVLSPNGNVIASSFKRYRTYYPKTGWAEQNPLDWYEAFKYTVNSIFEKKNLQKKDIVSIGIDGMMNSPVFLDDKGKVLRSTIIWMDQRSTAQVKWLKENLKNDIVLNGPITSTALLSKILWVKENQPDIWKETWKILLPKDFIRFKLNNSFVTDWSDASATQLFNVKELSWSDEICEVAGISKKKLPEAVSPTEVVGRLPKKTAIEIGLQEGIPIVAGCSDAASDNLTAGVIYPNQCLIRLGTCGALFMIIDKLPSNQSKRYYIIVHSMPNRWMIHLATPAGLALEWFQQTFFKEGPIITNEIFDAKAKKIPAGSQGLIFHPYLSGEHTPREGLKLRGDFVGINREHTKEHFNRAVLEGIAFSIKECFKTFEEINPEIKSIRAVGGGVKSILWREIITNVLGMEVELPAFEDPSFGAGLLGGIGIGLYKDFEDAVEKCVKIRDKVKPDKIIQKKYKKIFSLYTNVLDKLQNLPWM
ncbi:MAG: xylulokinase [Candidatus Atribacteria bacterium]|nr:MAG: xylulokinase [Candidatus Atribacteria bacterium]